MKKVHIRILGRKEILGFCLIEKLKVRTREEIENIRESSNFIIKFQKAQKDAGIGER